MRWRLPRGDWEEKTINRTPPPRLILHIDLDAFFCSVEELLDPGLKGKVFAVGHPARERGVISTASYAARKFGVHSAMSTAAALRLCPQLLLLPPRHRLYSDYSHRVMDILADAAPVMEQVSIDEAFLDCTGDPRSGEQIGAAIKEKIRKETGLACSIGVAPNKLIAKIATEKSKPDGLLVVPPGQEAGFLAPLPIGMLWGIGPKTRQRLEPLGIRTIGDLAHWPAEDLARRFGKSGRAMAYAARGMDDSPLEESREAKSISQETTFAKDIGDEAQLRRTLLGLSDRVAASLRAEGLQARTVRIKLRWPSFKTQTRQVTLARPTDLSEEIFRAAWRLFENNWRPGRAVRLIGVATGNLESGARQMTLLPKDTREDSVRLAKAIDRIRGKFEEQAVQRASALKRKRGSE